MKKTLPFTLNEARAWRQEYPTPFYIYDEAGIKKTVTDINEAFSWNKGFKEHFAVKACPTPAVLRLLRSLGCGTDCASLPEIEMSLRSGITGDSIVFTANEVTPAEYRAAYEAGALINLDDRTQTEILEEAGIVPDTICARYNPGEFQISNDIMGHLYDSKFGMPKEQLFETFRIMKERGTRHFGFHAMLASCSLVEDYYPMLARELFGLALEIREKLGITVEFIDFAGGVGIPYRPEEQPVDIRVVGERVHAVYDEIVRANGMEIRLMTEMGRFVTGPHGYLVTSVIGKKHIYREYIGVDATAACLMRPAIYGAYHHVTVLGKEDAPAAGKFDVVGSLCENNDKFAVDRELPETERGDILVSHDAGAHGHSMGYNYNGRLRCAELLLKEDGSVKMIRRAETMADYFATLDIDEEFV